MCGIIGIAGSEPVSAEIIKGLQKLEYRGYDSAGLAIFDNDQIKQKKVQGKLSNLIKSLDDNSIEGSIGIGHTRWATHGVPSETNAHPHSSPLVSIVHNGIIENASDLKKEVKDSDYSFISETDSEVITALLTIYLNQKVSHVDAVKKMVSKLKGSYALAILFNDLKDTIIGVKNESPLVVGHGKSGYSIGSDSIALSSIANKVCYLEDGDIVSIKKNNIEIINQSGEIANREFVQINVSEDETNKGSYNHFMEKEIHEHPQAVGETFRQFIDHDRRIISVDSIDLDFSDISKIHLIACGTAYYSCLVAKYYFEQYARISVECDMASEFRYRDPVLDSKSLCIFVSQSGETADTKAALDYCKSAKIKTLSIVNVKNSSIARESDYCLYTKAGVEIGVASTKAFTAQLSVLLSMAIHCGTINEKISLDENKNICQEIMQAPQLIENAIKRSYELKEIAKSAGKIRAKFSNSMVRPELLEQMLEKDEILNLAMEVIEDFSIWKPLDVHLEKEALTEESMLEVDEFLVQFTEIYQELTEMKKAREPKQNRTKIGGKKIYPETQNDSDIIFYPSYAMHGVDKMTEGDDRFVVVGNISKIN